MKFYFSFDVESVGLHGRPFAVGFVVVDETGQELLEGYLACPVMLHGIKDQWLIENVISALPDCAMLPAAPYANCGSEHEMLQDFWDAWTALQQQYDGIVMVTDCPWPVEAGFLSRCQQQIGFGMESSPYPVLDVMSLLHTAYDTPNDDIARLPAELPAHNPVNDARHSVRIMLEVMKEIKQDRGLAIAHGFYGPALPVTPSTLTFTELPKGTEPAEFSATTTIVVDREDDA